MQETPTINAVLSNIKAAADCTDLLKAARLSSEKTELEVKIAEMSSALAVAETAAADIRRALEENESKLKERQGSGAVRESLPYLNQAPDGRESGMQRDVSSCPHCRDISRRAIHLHFAWPQSICPHCRSGYAPPQASPQAPPGSEF